MQLPPSSMHSYLFICMQCLCSLGVQSSADQFRLESLQVACYQPGQHFLDWSMRYCALLILFNGMPSVMCMQSLCSVACKPVWVTSGLKACKWLATKLVSTPWSTSYTHPWVLCNHDVELLAVTRFTRIHHAVQATIANAFMLSW